mmetsp:Transcript_16285/g.25167  ORF Transcript_16285/g.25167 Transcript_16285/m.25167 type:complete len:327 (-) Transcript_16285:2609-3589(-)
MNVYDNDFSDEFNESQGSFEQRAIRNIAPAFANNNISVEYNNNDFNDSEGDSSGQSSDGEIAYKRKLSRSDHSLRQIKRKQEKQRSIPRKRADFLQDFDEAQLKAYERYVLAQFKYKDEASIEKERKSTIESLIPGTKFYFHLFFLDLAKKKRKIEDFTDEEKKLWDKFDESFGTSIQFYEAETAFRVINKIEDELPKDVGSATTDQDIYKIEEVVTYLRRFYLGGTYSTHHSKPEFLDPAFDHSSSQSGDEADENAKARPNSDISRVIGFLKPEDRLARKRQYLKGVTSETSYLSDEIVGGYEEDLDWSLVKHPQLVFSYAQNLI